MSSIIKSENNKKTVLLYVPGLGSSINYFDNHMAKLAKKNNRVKIYPGEIEINYNNDIKNLGAQSLDNNTQVDVMKFSNDLSNLIDFIKKNEDNVILVKTHLSLSYHKNSLLDYDSISKQSTKLINFIKGIKQIDSDIKIKLVGHSLGGIINLKAGIEIPNLIEEIISISTPYKPVLFAKLLWLIYLPESTINKFLELVKLNKRINYTNAIFEMSDSSNEEKEKYYGIVSALSNKSFFDSLKRKWYSLKNKPKLSVITGVSAHFMTTIPILFLEINNRYPFDGLVFGSEQTDIEATDKYILGNGAIECYNESKGYTNSCHKYFGLIENHVCNHKLPCLDIGSMLFNILKNLSIENEKESLKAFIDGFYNKALENEKYKFYYKMTNSQYSHSHLQDADETIEIILAKLI